MNLIPPPSTGEKHGDARNQELPLQTKERSPGCGFIPGTPKGHQKPGLGAADRSVTGTGRVLKRDCKHAIRERGGFKRGAKSAAAEGGPRLASPSPLCKPLRAPPPTPVGGSAAAEDGALLRPPRSGDGCRQRYRPRGRAAGATLALRGRAPPY